MKKQKSIKVLAYLIIIVSVLLITSGTYILINQQKDQNNNQDNESKKDIDINNTTEEILNYSLKNMENINTGNVDINIQTTRMDSENNDNSALEAIIKLDNINNKKYISLINTYLDKKYITQEYSIIENDKAKIYTYSELNGWALTNESTVNVDFHISTLLEQLTTKKLSAIESNNTIVLTIETLATELFSDNSGELAGIKVPILITISNDLISSVTSEFINENIIFKLQYIYSGINENQNIEIPIAALNSTQ